MGPTGRSLVDSVVVNVVNISMGPGVGAADISISTSSARALMSSMLSWREMSIMLSQAILDPICNTINKYL